MFVIFIETRSVFESILFENKSNKEKKLSVVSESKLSSLNCFLDFGNPSNGSHVIQVFNEHFQILKYYYFFCCFLFSNWIKKFAKFGKPVYSTTFFAANLDWLPKFFELSIKNFRSTHVSSLFSVGSS